jgi:hypothetical protein
MKDQVYYIPHQESVHGDPERWEQFAVDVANRAHEITDAATEFIERIGTRQGSTVLLSYLKMLDNVDQLQRMFDLSEEANATDARDTEA